MTFEAKSKRWCKTAGETIRGEYSVNTFVSLQTADLTCCRVLMAELLNSRAVLLRESGMARRPRA